MNYAVDLQFKCTRALPDGWDTLDCIYRCVIKTEQAEAAMNKAINLITTRIFQEGVQLETITHITIQPTDEQAEDVCDKARVFK